MKHLSQAVVLCTESFLGYPEHKWLAIGHMAEAESESLLEYPELAEAIRDQRVKFIENDEDIPNLMDLIKEGIKLLEKADKVNNKRK